MNKSRITHNQFGDQYKTPINKRLEGSKFRKQIEALSDGELKLLFIVAGVSPGTLEALHSFLTAPDNSIQIYALKLELEKRGIIASKIKMLQE